MKETTLWDHLREPLNDRGKFQKTNDRFTLGIPDILGQSKATGGCAFELKEFDEVRVWRLKFRPGQLDWLRDWEQAGGLSLIVSSHRQTVYAHRWEMGEELQGGVSPERVLETALLVWTKTRSNKWRECVNLLLGVRPKASGSARSHSAPGAIRIDFRSA